MHATFVHLITSIDGVIATLRAVWLYVETADGQARVIAAINELLDDRLQLMALRDAAAAQA